MSNDSFLLDFKMSLKVLKFYSVLWMSFLDGVPNMNEKNEMPLERRSKIVQNYWKQNINVINLLFLFFFYHQQWLTERSIGIQINSYLTFLCLFIDSWAAIPFISVAVLLILWTAKNKFLLSVTNSVRKIKLLM